ncbi:hypothetical protein KC722_01850, partial [Candidatus Kaiserbacteria bacterium]|nr:hypothetical protein [Candidatus Kaiserbacteria bacterium]
MTRMTTKTFGARFFALLTVFSLIISAFPAPFFVAEAAAGSTTLFSEDFESGFAQWSTTGSWSIVGAGGGSDGSKARALGPTPIGLLVASIPTTGYENIHISFAYRGTLDTGDSVLSGYNYDTTTSGISISAFNQTNAGDGVWHTFDQDLGPLADDNADFKIYFSPNSMDSGSDEFDVDTIIVTGDPISTTPDCSSTDTVADTTFDTFSLGDVDGQNDWSSTGSFDQEVVENTYGYDSFGCQSLRISNAVTSSSFGDQTFAAPFSDSVGEVDATAGGFPEGTRRTHYEAQFDIASTKPTEQQSGLALSVSPDRGDGSRMSYLSFADGASGIDVTFYDTQGTGNPADFVPQSLGTLDRSMPHTIKFVIDTKDGHSNDTVDIFIDGSLVYSGTTWENYYRFDSEAVAEQSPRLLKTILFRAAGTAVPANSGEGFLIDNLSLTASDPAPVVKSSNTITIMGDTAAGENQPGWLFNRDLSNATPIEFNTDAASIGAGSLYVQPLDSTPAHKFIGEYFLFGDIADLDEVTYDYQIGSGGSASDANEFYLNVYANYGESAPDNYYDCKYDVVPTVGSTGSFTTVTFDPNQSYPVTTRGTSPYTCPTVPAAMNFQSAGSIIRMFALNMGDTTAGDTGLDGYFDNVVVETKTDITTFDFDPDTTKPTVAIVSPAQAEVTGMDVTAF